jgi:hypothetical protein
MKIISIVILIFVLSACGKKEGTPRSKCINGKVYVQHWNDDFYTDANKTCIKDM